MVYSDCNAVNLIQDVKTRWWSTWRMLRRLRRLRPAINLLIATDKVDCVEITPTQWVILHQIEITLATMARWQRILEGDRFVTGSLVVIALYRIRKAYVSVYLSGHTEPAVKNLTAILLKDFDT